MLCHRFLIVNQGSGNEAGNIHRSAISVHDDKNPKLGKLQER